MDVDVDADVDNGIVIMVIVVNDCHVWQDIIRYIDICTQYSHLIIRICVMYTGMCMCMCMCMYS
jgi:hypothetical protein